MAILTVTAVKARLAAFAEVRLDPRGGVFLGVAADLADHDHRFGGRVVREQRQRVDEARADQRIAADADAGGLAEPVAS